MGKPFAYALTPSQGVWASSVFYNSEIQVELSLDEISVTDTRRYRMELMAVY